MTVLRQIEELAALPGPVHLAIGVFDGVHLGHQAVIRRATAQPGTAVVLTFDQHPERILRPGSHPLMLTSTRHRVEILRRLGLRHLLVLTFDREFSRLPAEQFVDLLQRACRPLGSVAVGREWTFGHQGIGNVELLRRMGVPVHAVEPVLVDGAPVSSTRVRRAIVEARLEEAMHLLGRPYSILGHVVEGRRLGSTLGFPTANLATENEQLPPAGVYLVQARIGDDLRPGVANLGLRPTLDEAQPALRLEVHLLDFSGDLYGAEMEVEFLSRLRDERRFASLDHLREAIQRDVAEARARLAADHCPASKAPQDA